MKTLSKTKTFLAFASILAILLATSHVLHFVSPFLELSQEVEDGDSIWIGIPEDPNDFVANDLFRVAIIFNTYDWENYNASDFPDWMEMPEEYPNTLNASDGDTVPIWMGYAWSQYDPYDFPDWMNPPETLPSDFDGSDPDDVQDFMFDNMDPEMMAQVVELMEQYEENPAIFGTAVTTTDSFFSVLGIPFISVIELVLAIVFLAAAIILFIISRTVGE